jgi:Protein of unknown function (DUF3999)
LLESAPLQLAVNRDRYWRIEIVEGDAAAIGENPQLHLQWLADELMFVARGEAPFQLAAGSANVAPGSVSLDALLAGFDPSQRESLTANAFIGERRALGGKAALIARKPPLPWQRYLLWALLIAAVALLARMALGLLRQLNSSAAKP